MNNEGTREPPLGLLQPLFTFDNNWVSNVKIILCFHEEILKMGTSSEILIFRSAVMWLSIFKTIRLLYLI
ncbi:hypothetical protein Peur_055204 [Populus x canadensis]